MGGPTRFIADAMLGSLARKLRIFGFDTLYFRDGPDAELERIAKVEDRVILTSDRALFERSSGRGLPALMISGSSERARLESLLARSRAASLSLTPGGPRCALCNCVLERLNRAQVSGFLPDSMSRRHRVFYRCTACQKFYWKGGHWSRMRVLSSLMKRNPPAAP
ncbi:MAG: Mut7-C RNAse domain-containing protein [Thaumarchaeota archaeon]|nr:Mut7-C RNAse domain-containing protein [Nitrososphaerota archaeon]